MNMTITELLAKLDEQDLIITYDGDDSKYIDFDIILLIDGESIGGYDIDNGEISFKNCDNDKVLTFDDFETIITVESYKSFTL